VTSNISRGRSAFNERRFFEAHELWEEAWLGAGGEDKRGLQGLIQLAASLHKAAEVGSASGCVRLAEASLAKLRGADGRGLGLDVSGLAAEAEAFADAATRWAEGEADRPGTETFPKLRPLRRRPASRRKTDLGRRESTRTKRPS